MLHFITGTLLQILKTHMFSKISSSLQLSAAIHINGKGYNLIRTSEEKNYCCGSLNYIKSSCLSLFKICCSGSKSAIQNQFRFCSEFNLDFAVNQLRFCSESI